MNSVMDDEFDAEELKLYEALYSLIGAKIRFKCDGYFQEGIIFTIKPGARRVILKNVYFILPEKKVFSGMLRYRFSDLVKYEVVATAKELNPYSKNEYMESLLKNQDVGKKYSLNDLFFDGMLSEESDDEENDLDSVEEEFKLDVPFHLQKKIPCDSVVIDSFDLEWKQAIQHISLQKMIGVSFHGYKISRLGKLSWICISTSWCVFLFDMEKLGNDAFPQGLRSIFEKKQIMKVIHDCRFFSDCLAHKFGTKLVNVFDTLVAEFVVSMQCYNDKHKYNFVQSLNSCLRMYLYIDPEFLDSRDRSLRKDGGHNYLSKRPVTNALRYVLIKDTVYLLLLQDVLAKKLLGPLHRNVERYLTVIAGATRQELDTVGDEISSPDYIPPAVLMYGIQTVQFRKPEKKVPVSLECKFIDPVTGKLVEVKKQSNHDESYVQSNTGKEDQNSKRGSRKQRLPVLHHRVTVESTELEKKSSVVDKITMRPSRHVDEVYHKLVNSRQFRSQNPENVTNVKPSELYVSKFTMRVPLECSAFNSDTSRDCDSHTSKAEVKDSKIVDSSDYSDTWAKLREAFKQDSQPFNRKSKPIRLVPAGMSC